MVSFNILVTVAVTYTLLLFAVAFYADQRARRGPSRWLRSPWTYTLSLSVYCTAWTFYGAVGNAARSGLEYLTIYLGPTLVFLAWWWLLRKLVRIGKAELHRGHDLQPLWKITHHCGHRHSARHRGDHSLYRAAIAVGYFVCRRVQRVFRRGGWRGRT